MNVEPSLWERASWRIRHGALLSLVALASLAMILALERRPLAESHI